MTILTTSPASAQKWKPLRFGRPDKVQSLAWELDRVQGRIDEYGSVVAKSPDVWGESRLMRHRADVEEQLKARLEGFQFRINARQATRDAAFLSQVFALQQKLQAGDVSFNDAIPGTTGADATAQTPADPRPASVTAELLKELALSDNDAIPRSGFATKRGRFQGSGEDHEVGIEPVIELDQLNRYLQHLNELRRLNEGDDTADAPGYSLNLIRIPVSILPGRRTRTGYGAEVEFTIEPGFGSELLPIAFRDFVINGVKNRIAYPVFDIATTDDISHLADALHRYYASNDTTWKGPELFATYKYVASLDKIKDFPAAFKVLKEDVEAAREVYVELAKAGRAALRYKHPIDLDKLSENARKVMDEVTAKEREEQAKAQKVLAQAMQDRILAAQKAQQALATFTEAGFAVDQTDAAVQKLAPALRDRRRELSAAYENMLASADAAETASEIAKVAMTAAGEAATKAAISFASQLLDEPLATNYVPAADYTSLAPSFTESVNGHTLQVIAKHIYTQLVIPSESEIPEADRAANGLTYPATEEVLLSELKAAYTFLSRDSARHLWERFCTRDLANRILEHRRSLPGKQFAGAYRRYKQVGGVDPSIGIHTLRKEFFDAIAQDFPQAKGSVVASLAWHIIVESAVLNDRLIRDIKETSPTQTCQCLSGTSVDFVGPSPTKEARRVFEEYVNRRWPIHVFSLDPVTQDQNVGDEFQRRRELQMILAIAAQNQLFGWQSLTQAARRLEYDLETISLNRTAVGFSHGTNTFGWRFYPRIQSPPVSGHFKASVTEMLGRGQSSDDRLKQSRLEAGMRECTALVVMPSFLPKVTVNVRTNWFPLGGKKFRVFNKRDPGYSDSISLSRDITQLRTLANSCKSDTHLYRNGELARLIGAVDRLDKRLPLQTHSVEVPWENTLGGFEMFNTGTTTLKPQLLGWYGAPGVAVSNLSELRSAAALVEQLTQAERTANLAYLRSKARGDDAKDQEALKAAAEAATKAKDDARKAATELRLAAGTTRVFLVGKNFSVLDTEVIAGGVDVTATTRLLSRNLMSVEIPSTVSTVQIERRKAAKQRHVVVNLMTPYGAASNRLLIPVHDLATPAAATTAAAAEAKKAVDTHIAAAHPVSYKLDGPKKEVAAAMIVKVSDVVKLHIHSGADQKVKIENSTGKDIEELLNNKKRPGQVAFRITAASNDATTKAKQLKAGPFDFKVGEELDLKPFLDKVAEAVRTGLPYDFNPKELSVQPYVRFTDPAADRTIFKVEGTVTIKTKTVQQTK